TMNLTAKRIARLLKTPGRYHDDEHKGLYLQVIGPKNASWILRYERDGRERMIGLGPLHTVKLKAARERARAARLMLLDGVDPLQGKGDEGAARVLAEARNVSFAEAAQQYFKHHEKGWPNKKHQQQFLNSMRDYTFPVLGNMPVATIDTPLVLKVLRQPVAATRGNPAGTFWEVRPETASRVRNRIEAVLDWAAVFNYRTGDNPARWKGHLSEALPARNKLAKVEHHPALPYRELPAFIAALRGREGVAALALEFTILTAAR